MPSNRRPARQTGSPANTGATRSAKADMVQVTWVIGVRTFSREFTDPSDPEIRATRIRRMAAGARNVSTNKITAGQTYIQHGEEHGEN